MCPTTQFHLRIMALPLVYGGPAPHFFAFGCPVAEYIFGIHQCSTSVDDIPNAAVLSELIKVISIFFSFL